MALAAPGHGARPARNQSSSGQYFAGLGHVRGLAAFLVVTWHFAHWDAGQPVPFNGAAWLGPIDEGHLGVSVFMVLSGYLFARLIGERRVHYAAFLRNRAVRLLPLLAFTMFIYAVANRVELADFAGLLASGVLLPTLPNGGWSITAEAHFYLILPLLLFALRNDRRAIFAMLGLSVALRLGLYLEGYDVQQLAYLTLVGRFDQFAIGVAAGLLGKASGKLALASFAALWAGYGLFDAIGGYYNAHQPAIWIVLPTLEGLAIAAMIAWYDRNPLPDIWLLRKAGEYSYSIYLLHFFFVHQAAMLVNDHVMRIDSLPLALPWAFLFFLAMLGIGHLSWKLVEEPPLKWRVPYLRERTPHPPRAIAGIAPIEQERTAPV